MNRLVFNNIFRFIFLVLIQVLFMNKINFYGFLNPYIYILFILLLPFETPGWLLLLLSFFIGLTVDLFTGTLGLHAASSVFAGYVRPAIIKLVGEKPEYDITTQPQLQQMGLKWFIAYALLMTIAHQLFLNMLDVFSLDEIWQTLLRVLVSSLFTFLFIMLFEYIFAPRKEKL
ncbi:MAG: rod shape-determining protein MreD [Bacteroidota bacterium]